MVEDRIILFHLSSLIEVCILDQSNLVLELELDLEEVIENNKSAKDITIDDRDNMNIIKPGES